jgi:butyrate kinase
LILLICLQVDYVPIQVLSGDQELEVLAEASGFVAEDTEQSKEISQN